MVLLELRIFLQWQYIFKTQHILIVGRMASKVNGVPTCIDNEVVKNYGWCAQNPCDENGWENWFIDNKLSFYMIEYNLLAR